MPSHRRHTLALVALTGILLGCGSDDPSLANPARNPYEPIISPADFSASTLIDNPYFPQIPGTVRIYEGQGERVVVTVLSETRMVMGIECLILHDEAYEEGQLVEDTFDWFAQDDDGNVWYFGEDSYEIEKGKRLSEGSWEAGVDGALPGLIMLARPLAGVWYRQEFYEGEAEDIGQIISLDEVVETPAGTFVGCLKTLDLDALEPGVEEHKWYAPGIGIVAEREFKGGTDELRLVAITTP